MTKFRHNECTQHVVSLHGGHVVPSALRSSTATTVKARDCIDILSTEFMGKNRGSLGVRSLALCKGLGGGEYIFNKDIFFEHWL